MVRPRLCSTISANPVPCAYGQARRVPPRDALKAQVRNTFDPLKGGRRDAAQMGLAFGHGNRCASNRPTCQKAALGSRSIVLRL